MQDYYKILDLPQNIKNRELRATLRRLTLRFYPRTNKDEWKEHNFRVLLEATEVLGDKTTRAQYDAIYGMAILRKAPPSNSPENKLFLAAINDAVTRGQQNAQKFRSDKKHFNTLVWKGILNSFGDSLFTGIVISPSVAGALFIGPVLVLSGIFFAVKYYNDKFILIGIMLLLMGLGVIWYKVRAIQNGE